MTADTQLSPQNFNSHAHVERDASSASSVSFISNFNSHAHVERDLQRQLQVVLQVLFQLTRSRGA